MTADEGDAEEFDFLERCFFLGHYLLELVILSLEASGSVDTLLSTVVCR